MMANTNEDLVQEFINRLEALSNDAYDYAFELKQKGFEPGVGSQYFGRCVSCFVGIKTLLFTMTFAQAHKEYEEEVINKVLPAKFPRRDITVAQKYMVETHMAIRFALFQNFYSQTEFAYRIIQRDKFPTENANPFKSMRAKFGIMDAGFVAFINGIRNSIHNNGHYFPQGDEEQFSYDFNGKAFLFEKGKAIRAVTMIDILDIISHVLKENRKLFENDELAKIVFA